MQVGDVMFSVINSRPENRKVFTASGDERSTSDIVVRAFTPVVTAGVSPVDWVLARWNVRLWCRDSKTFQRFLSSFLVVDRLEEVSTLRPIRDRARPSSRALALPSPVGAFAPPRTKVGPTEEELADVTLAVMPHGDDDPSLAVLNELAQALADGVDHLPAYQFSSPLSEDTLKRLAELGAVAVTEDEEGDVAYTLVPAGVQWAIKSDARGIINDIDFLTSSMHAVIDDMSKHRPPSKLSKIELLFLLLDKGHKPEPTLIGRCKIMK